MQEFQTKHKVQKQEKYKPTSTKIQKKTFCISPEKQNQDLHLSGFSKKHNLPLRTNELGRKAPSQFLICEWTREISKKVRNLLE